MSRGSHVFSPAFSGGISDEEGDCPFPIESNWMLSMLKLGTENSDFSELLSLEIRIASLKANRPGWFAQIPPSTYCPGCAGFSIRWGGKSIGVAVVAMATSFAEICLSRIWPGKWAVRKTMGRPTVNREAGTISRNLASAIVFDPSNSVMA